MTAIPAIGTHADLQLGPAKAPSPLPAHLPNGASVDEAATPHDPSSTIKCICGYNDDDGNTVLCELCDTWQHMDCYYPADVPDVETLVHECVDCTPRSLDTKSATERQKQIREQQILGDRRVKRPATKSHKKKTKDSITTNGWPAADRADSAERPSGSPRDQQPPPAKRPKTGHKASASVASVNQLATVANARRKPGSSTLAGQSPVKSPPALTTYGYGGDYFSPEFMRLHQQPAYQPAEANSFTSIGLTNDLTAWLQDPEALAEVANGIDPRKLFWRPDRSFAELESIYPSLTKHTEEDKNIAINGVHPVIQWLTVDSAIPANAMIGEIKGHISRFDEYAQDPSNRWAALRHPEPYVFFPPHLPVVIDAREEGTLLRYIRRSCQPNAQMKIIIDKGRDYHFCFISMEDIHEGDEITIAWDLDRDVRQILSTSYSNGNIKKEGIHGEDEQFISSWASGVLANFGGCACRRPDGFCMLGRFDRRNQQLPPENGGHTLKPPKTRKGKKNLSHISPLSTGHATNSRASSEAAYNRPELFEDRGDSRSVSGSSRSKPTSRDNTPGAISVEAMLGLGVELSERERRKMQQIEKRFDLMGQDEGPGKKKKRPSGGSALNTPSIITSLAHNNSENPSPTLALSSKSFKTLPLGYNGTPGNSRNTLNLSINMQIERSYAETSTQTASDDEHIYSRQLAGRKRKRPSYTQRMLQRSEEGRPKRAQSERAPTPLVSAPSPKPSAISPEPLKQPLEDERAPDVAMPPPPKPAQPGSVPAVPEVASKATPPEDSQDVAMEDAPQEPSSNLDATTNQPDSATAASQVPSEPAPTKDAPIEPPAPPWTDQASSPSLNIPMAEPSTSPTADVSSSAATNQAEAPTISEPTKSPAEPDSTPPTSAASSSSQRPQNLHVTLPPPPSFSSLTPTTPTLVATPGLVTGSSVAQSPSTAQGPLFSPAVQSAVAPSPMKKKLSLSDYTNRKRKNEAVAAAKEAAAAAEKEKDTNPLPAVTDPSLAADDKDKLDGSTESDKEKKDRQGSALSESLMAHLPPLIPL